MRVLRTDLPGGQYHHGGRETGLAASLSELSRLPPLLPQGGHPVQEENHREKAVPSSGHHLQGHRIPEAEGDCKEDRGEEDRWEKGGDIESTGEKTPGRRDGGEGVGGSGGQTEEEPAEY